MKRSILYITAPVFNHQGYSVVSYLDTSVQLQELLNKSSQDLAVLVNTDKEKQQTLLQIGKETDSKGDTFVENTFDIRGLKLKMKVFPSKALLTASQSSFPVLVLFCGIFVAIILGSSVYFAFE